MKNSLVFTCLLVCSFAGSTTRLSSVDSVHFRATGPAGLQIKGTTQEMSLTLEGDVFVLRVPLDSVKTGIGLRDRHMKEKYLHTQTFPMAELTFSKNALKEGNSQKASAQFKVHGVEKTIEVLYDVARTGDRLLVEGLFQINIKHYGIEVPNYLGVTVKPDIQVTAKFEVRPL